MTKRRKGRPSDFVMLPSVAPRSTRQRQHGMRSILIGFALCTAFNYGAARAESPASPSAEVIAKGKALTEAGDCGSCHTADPSKPLAGGKRIDTPFGAIYSANLTPDRNTGLGLWSDEAFVRAMRFGVGPDGTHYYPAFPYPHFTKLIRDDILAIRGYLATLEPVSNTPPAPQLNWPLNYRVLMAAWNFMFFRPGIFEPDQNKSTERNRGGYLVEGVAHCGACHTPKNLLGAEKTNARFTGSPVDGWFAPRLDGAARAGLKSWSVEDITEYLQSGRNARSHADGPMAEVVLNSTSRMSDADVRAIAVYLKDISPGVPEPVVTPPSQAQMANGEKLYRGSCVGCHELDGSGAPRIYPPLPGNANLQSEDPASAIKIVLVGAETITTARAPNTGSMPPYANKMSDQEVADVVTYVRNAWGNAAPAVTAAEVAKARK
jgi:mono/diheme cytochrome c family protein